MGIISKAFVILLSVGFVALLKAPGATDEPQGNTLTPCEILDSVDPYMEQAISVAGEVIGFHYLILTDKRCPEVSSALYLSTSGPVREKLVDDIQRIREKVYQNGNLHFFSTVKGRLQPVNRSDPAQPCYVEPKVVSGEVKYCLSVLAIVDPVPVEGQNEESAIKVDYALARTPPPVDLGEPKVLSPEYLAQARTNMKRVIKRLSLEYGLTNLADKRLTDVEMELRIWGDVGVDFEKVFILKSANGKMQATLLIPKRSDHGVEHVRSKQNRDLKVTTFDHPKSGWAALSRYLSSNNIRYPLPFALDNLEDIPAPDEGLVFLEIKQGSKYDLVFYGQFTRFERGKAMRDFCSKMETEFGTEIGCGEPSE